MGIISLLNKFCLSYLRIVYFAARIRSIPKLCELSCCETRSFNLCETFGYQNWQKIISCCYGMLDKLFVFTCWNWTYETHSKRLDIVWQITILHLDLMKSLLLHLVLFHSISIPIILNILVHRIFIYSSNLHNLTSTLYSYFGPSSRIYLS